VSYLVYLAPFNQYKQLEGDQWGQDTQVGQEGQVGQVVIRAREEDHDATLCRHHRGVSMNGTENWDYG
jgi:hypothetical protein